MSTEEASCSNSWTKEEDKAFENAIANYPEETVDRWEKIGEKVPGKTLEEIKNHYYVLVDDVSRIESGCVPLPVYINSCSDSSGNCGDEGTSKKGGNSGHNDVESHPGIKSSRSEQERRKGIAWTEEEHRLFLLGLDKYGKGDWRSISRNFVVTRTPTQVASHAQKYFIRLNSMNKDRRRSSIHDITSPNGDVAGPPTPTSAKQPPHLAGPAMAQAAVGTPVTLPLYGRAPMAYQTPPTSAYR